MPIVLVVLLIIIEGCIYGYSLNLDVASKLHWQLTARYSARVSFLLLFSAQIISLLKGFSFNQKFFKTLVLGFVVNHIIHLFFLMYVMYLSNWAFSWIRHILAGTAYVVLLFWLVQFFTTKTLSSKLDWFSWILCFHSGVIFIITYWGRYSNELMPYANKYVYLVLLILSIIGIVCQVMALLKYRKSSTLS